MKTFTDIANTLRTEGRMFSNPNLKDYLKTIEPMVAHGRTVLYSDDTVQACLNKFVKIKNKKEKTVPDKKRLARIEKMLEAICKALEIKV